MFRPPPFKDRLDAGRELAQALTEYRDRNALTLGIPRGGVHVAKPVAQALRAELDTIVLRKLPIPWEPEAGFGAITAEGDIVLNDLMVRRLGLTQEMIDRQAERVRAEVKRRARAYRGDRPFPDLRRRPVIVVDDGLATGYTMIAALQSARRRGAEELICAVPVSPRDTLAAVRQYCDRAVCLVIADDYPFAVASFYEQFPDMSDEEVRELLRCDEGRDAAGGRIQ
jgi:putative phosphoribosyl transferase